MRVIGSYATTGVNSGGGASATAAVFLPNCRYCYKYLRSGPPADLNSTGTWTSSNSTTLPGFIDIHTGSGAAYKLAADGRVGEGTSASPGSGLWYERNRSGDFRCDGESP